MRKSDIPLEKIVYVRPAVRYVPKRLRKFFALDTETMPDGTPLMICSSEGDVWKVEDIPRCFFSRKYRGSTFFVYNLRFDAGVLLRWLPKKCLRDLIEYGVCEYEKYIVEYIPHKFLKIRTFKDNVKFFDLLQFYGCSLETASQKYLGEGKMEIETKKFTREYVDKHWDEIRRYCIRDAELTKRLAETLIRHLHRFGVDTDKFYSSAYLGSVYLRKKQAMNDVWKFWTRTPSVIEYALKSYRGGKFEMVKRGCAYMYEYDLRSAYPAELRNCVDLRHTYAIHSRKYETSAVYGFLKCRISVPDVLHHSVGMFEGNVQTYPVGAFTAYITKQEYDWLIQRGCDVEILDGWWIIPDRIEYVYRDVVDELYRLKEKYRGQNDMLSHIAKIMLNGLYGKMIQMIPDLFGEVRAGPLFNPIHASVVTANVRLKVSDIQNQYPDDIVAVHTDSVISLRPLGIETKENIIGTWKYETEGIGVMILCGIYQVGSKVATRCYSVEKDVDWFEYLRQGGKSTKVKIVQTRAISWIESVQMEKYNPCEFVEEEKELDINIDRKRVWIHHTNCEKLLQGIETSIPYIRMEVI
jgi:hypothetical protein